MAASIAFPRLKGSVITRPDRSRRLRRCVVASLVIVCPAIMALDLRVEGADPDGAQIVTQLKRALKKSDPDLRREAVIDAGRLSGHLNARQKKSAAAAIYKALRDESVTEIKRLMIKAMARFGVKHAWVPVILASRDDADRAVREEARHQVLNGGADLLAVIKQLLKEETSVSMRAEYVLILRDRRKYDAVPMLIEALRDKEGQVVAAAAESLEAISGKAFGYDPGKWKAWHKAWLKERPKGATGPSVAPEVVKEPEPHVTRSLRPKFYGLALTAKDLVFVVDISGSVGSGGVQRAKRQLIEAVNRLGSDVNIAALFFAEEVQYWKDGKILPATPQNKEDLANFLRGVKPGKRTEAFLPLLAGVEIVRKRVKAKEEAHDPFRTPVALIAVSDGWQTVQDKLLPQRRQAMWDKVERLDPAHTVVHSIVLGKKDSRLMYELANRGGGHYIRAERD